jgi:hypothetical protein
MTEDQKKCYELLCDAFYGAHHLQGNVVPWGFGIKLNRATNDLATFDFNELTTLVVLAHYRCIRIAITQSGPHKLGITAHARKGRSGGVSERHPTIEDAIKSIRRVYE